MSKKTLAAGTSPFAHLIGGAVALAARVTRAHAEDEDMPDAEHDDEDPDAEDQDLDEPEKGKKSKKAKGEGDDEDADAEHDDEDPDAEEPEDEKEAKGFRAGVAAANKRAAAIFMSKAATGRPDLAAQLAFGTRMSSAEAIGVLAAAGTPATATIRGRSLDDRMSRRNDARPGADTPGKASGSKLADRMIAVGRKLGQMGAE